MKLMNERIIILLLEMVMIIGIMPMTVFATEGTKVTETTELFSVHMELAGVSFDVGLSERPENTRYFAACGDSITHANHALVEDINTDDPYYPIDGYSGTKYARKNYAYYIAARNNMQWANYGYGGTTLHHCYPKGYGGTSMRTFPFVDERITQLKEGIEWDYISIFFGYNDTVYGPVQQRDFWLTETYGEELGYPINDSQIGTEGFANAEQKAACDAATGSVGGIEYIDNTEYFFAKFVGTVDDTETTTFLGAYNYALDYLSKKYPDAKIMIVNPYVSGTNNTRKILRDGVNAIAEKWSVSCMDFSDLPYWFYGVDQKRVEFPNPHREDGRWYAANGKANYAGTVEGYNRARFTTDGTHPSNLGYQTISKPMERVLISSDKTVNVLQGKPFEAELILDDVYTDMDVSITMGGTDITDQCYANGKIRIESVTGDVIIRANGNITYTDSHIYSPEITPPTCTEQGYTTYTCTCGDSYMDNYVGALDHNYGEWYEVTPATCTEDGLERRGCKRCNAFETNVISKRGHSYSSVTIAPTCTEQGYTTYTCDCGDSYVDNYVDAFGHTRDKEVVENYVEPTCTADGSYDSVLYCSVCSAELDRKTVVVEASGHSYENWVQVIVPKCEIDGVERRDCADCEKYETRDIAAPGHEWTEEQNSKVCESCGEMIKLEIDHSKCGAGLFETIVRLIINFFRILFGLPEICFCGEELSQ